MKMCPDVADWSDSPSCKVQLHWSGLSGLAPDLYMHHVCPYTDKVAVNLLIVASYGSIKQDIVTNLTPFSDSAFCGHTSRWGPCISQLQVVVQKSFVTVVMT